MKPVWITNLSWEHTDNVIINWVSVYVKKRAGIIYDLQRSRTKSQRVLKNVTFRTSPSQKTLPYQVPNQKKVWRLWFGLTTIQHSVMLAKRRSTSFPGPLSSHPPHPPPPYPFPSALKPERERGGKKKREKNLDTRLKVKSFNSHFHCSAILQNTNSRDLDQKNWNEESYQRNYKIFYLTLPAPVRNLTTSISNYTNTVCYFVPLL